MFFGHDTNCSCLYEDEIVTKKLEKGKLSLKDTRTDVGGLSARVFQKLTLVWLKQFLANQEQPQHNKHLFVHGGLLEI